MSSVQYPGTDESLQVLGNHASRDQVGWPEKCKLTTSESC